MKKLILVGMILSAPFSSRAEETPAGSFYPDKLRVETEFLFEDPLLKDSLTAICIVRLFHGANEVVGQQLYFADRTEPGTFIDYASFCDRSSSSLRELLKYAEGRGLLVNTSPPIYKKRCWIRGKRHFENEVTLGRSMKPVDPSLETKLAQISSLLASTEEKLGTCQEELRKKNP